MSAIESESVTVDGIQQLPVTVFTALGAFFFFLMLVLPTTFQLERGVLLSLLAAGALIAAGTRWRVSRDIVLLCILTLSVGAIGIFWGYVNNTPGALRVSTVYILWPVVYMLFLGLVHSPSTIVLLEKTLVVGVAVAALMAIALLGDHRTDEFTIGIV